ncbi:hypothetical protein C4D60_Mb07t23240 [Musa balbisiana]|uniref:Uncharacterized protein n=1 Tax=Musa balbisiana TaxID=52838 RepID=A0A4S8JJD2_MUSBA|nr:hypothetical protein C4D60_Mb07t23240 [Musa balbisiana]
MCICIYVTSYLSNSIPAGDLYILGHSLPVSLLATFGVISYVYYAYRKGILESAEAIRDLEKVAIDSGRVLVLASRLPERPSKDRGFNRRSCTRVRRGEA